MRSRAVGWFPGSTEGTTRNMAYGYEYETRYRRIGCGVHIRVCKQHDYDPIRVRVLRNFYAREKKYIHHYS